MTWQELRVQLTWWFKDGQTMSLYHRFSLGRQQDTVASHCEQFELLSLYEESLRDDNMIAVFISGLADQIKQSC